MARVVKAHVVPAFHRERETEVRNAAFRQSAAVKNTRAQRASPRGSAVPVVPHT